MLTPLQSIRLFLVLLAVTFLSSCDNEKGSDPAPDDKTCNVSKVKSGTDESEFRYDASGKLIRINATANGQIVSYQTLEYNSNGQLTKSTEFTGNEPTATQEAYTTYEYNNAGQLSKETVFNEDFATGDFEANGFITYEYNSNKQLIKSTNYEFESGTAVKVGFTDFTTDAQGNIIKAITYSSENGKDELEAQIDMTYDTTPNILKKLTGTYSDLAGTGFSAPATLSTNNITSLTATFMGVPVLTLTNTYTTNSDDLIVAVATVIASPFDPSLNQTTNSTLEYNCN